MQNSVLDFPKPAPWVEKYNFLSTQVVMWLSAPKEGLQQMCQKSLLLALSLDHAMCGVPYRAMLKVDFAELEHSEETLETW